MSRSFARFRWNAGTAVRYRLFCTGCGVLLACWGSSLILCLNTKATRDTDFSKLRSHTSFDQSSRGNIDVQELLPSGLAVPANAVSARLTINPDVNAWFSSEVNRSLVKLERDSLSVEEDASPDSIQVNAVLVDADSRIRVIYSNSERTYFGASRLPLASTAKIFVAVGLGNYDISSARYCVPRTFTSWLTVDAARSASCPPKARTVSANMAFAKSMPAPLLWRSHQVLTDEFLSHVLLKLGMRSDASGSLKNAAIMGALQARPIEMHRAVQAITLALAGSTKNARLPMLIDAVRTDDRNGNVQDIAVFSPAIPRDSYLSILTPSVTAYLRDVLYAPITSGTLKSLSDMNLSELGIGFLWGKTGTYAIRGKTLDAWIVGGVSINGAPYSWLFLIRSTDENHSFGNTNAASFAPIARLLIQAAIRDSSSSGAADPIVLPIGR